MTKIRSLPAFVLAFKSFSRMLIVSIFLVGASTNAGILDLQESSSSIFSYQFVLTQSDTVIVGGFINSNNTSTTYNLSIKDNLDQTYNTVATIDETGFILFELPGEAFRTLLLDSLYKLEINTDDNNLAPPPLILNMEPIMFAAGPDSISQSVVNAIASGDLQALKNLLEIGSLSGGMNPAEIAAINAAISKIEIIQKAIIATQISLIDAPVGSAAFKTTTASIMNAFFKYAYNPPCNAISIAVMQYYLQLATSIIEKYQSLISKTNDPVVIARYYQDIQNQLNRIQQINLWLSSNGVIE